MILHNNFSFLFYSVPLYLCTSLSLLNEKRTTIFIWLQICANVITQTEIKSKKKTSCKPLILNYLVDFTNSVPIGQIWIRWGKYLMLYIYGQWKYNSSASLSALVRPDSFNISHRHGNFTASIQAIPRIKYVSTFHEGRFVIQKD